MERVRATLRWTFGRQGQLLLQDYEAVHKQPEPEAAPEGGDAPGGDGGNSTPALQRSVSAFDCPYCYAQIAGWGPFEKHLETCAAARQ